MSTSKHRCALAALFVASALACGCASEPDEVDADADLPADQADYYGRLATAYSAQIDRCCVRVGLHGAVNADDTRRGYIMGRPRPESGAVFNAEEGERCIHAVAQAPCRLSKDPYPHEPECDLVFTGGGVPLGGECQASQECAGNPGLDTGCVGRSEGGRTVFRCRATSPLGAGESCASEVDSLVSGRCLDGLRCDHRTVTCEARPILGESCETTSGRGDTCGHGVMCDRDDTATCIPAPGYGTPCETREDCESNACVFGACREPFHFVDEWSCAP